MSVPAISVENLTYKYPNNTVGLENVSFSLNWGERLIIVGPNGAGKSTLLKLLLGLKLSVNSSVKLDGFDPFRDSSKNITTLLSTDWILNAIVKRDMPVKTLISSVGADQYPERRDKLLEILDIDMENWNMNEISDGQRRRVQLLLKIYSFWEILLLDEVTVDLDVLVRLRLLNWLKNETETRRCCVVYATHIFDGLASLGFPTHVCHMRDGKIERYLDFKKDIEFTKDDENVEVKFNQIERILENGEQETPEKIKIGRVESIHPLALKWLAQDYILANEN